MFVEVPIYHNSEIVSYSSIDLKLPYCVGAISDLRFKYKVFTANECISFTKVWSEEHYIFTRVAHKSNSSETENSKILGESFLRFGFMRDDVQKVTFEEIKPYLDLCFNDVNTMYLSLLLSEIP